MHIVPVEIQVLSSLRIDQETTLTRAQNVKAGRRQRLVQKKARVLLEQSARGRIQMLALPRSACHRQVYVAFGLRNRIDL
jgi:hypothetical protein